MSGAYPFWEKELKAVSSLIDGIAPDYPICVTGVPSFERKYAVEGILKEKNVDYHLYSCNSRSNIRSILFELCRSLCKLIDTSCVIKSTGELLLDLQTNSELYFEKMNQSKSFYVIFDCCEKLEEDVYDLISLLPSKVCYLGVILLSVSFDPYKPNFSFIIHLPVLKEAEIESFLNSNLGDTRSSLTDMIVHAVVQFFAVESHSLSELYTLRDMAISECIIHGYATKEEIDKCMMNLQNSLFVNIRPIYTDRMDNLQDDNEMIPLDDFCGVDISLNAKLLLIASYLCSIYSESDDNKLFGRDNPLSVKSKGRRGRRAAPVQRNSKSSYFSINRLIALYQCIKQTFKLTMVLMCSLFPEMKASTSNYGLILSQISVLLQLGLLSQVGGTSHTIDLNQLLYRCCIKKVNVINIAKNINFDITPYV